MNRLCGSSLDAAITASRTLESDDAHIVVAGGVDSMTRPPRVPPKPDRTGAPADTDHGVFPPGPDGVRVLETYGITAAELRERLSADLLP